MIDCLMMNRDGSECVLCYDPEQNRLWEGGQEIAAVGPVRDLEKSGDKTGLHVRIAMGKSCNFSCAYCSQSVCRDAGPDPMPEAELAHLVLRHAGDRPIDCIQFWGGEPFLYFDLMRSLHRAFADRRPNLNFATVTNGSLLFGERLDWVLEHGIALGISWDGPGQALRGKDILADPRILASVRAILEKQPERLNFNPVMTRDNRVHKHYLDALEARIGTRGVGLGEARVATIMDEQGYACTIPEKDLPEYSRALYKEFISGELSQIHALHSDARTFMLELGRPVTRMTHCFASSPNTLVLDLAGNILTCQNFSAEAVDEECGEAHCLGHISALDGAAPKPVPQMRRLLRKHKTRCARCVVFAICRGGCPYSPSRYDDYNCLKGYYHHLPAFGLALFHLTGKLLQEVRP